MAKSHRDDLDLEPELEQDSGPEEADERRFGADDSHLPSAQEELEEAVAGEGLTVIDDDPENQEEEIDAIELAADPEADAAIDEALEVHDPSDYAAAEAASDDEIDGAFEDATATGAEGAAEGIATDLADEETSPEDAPADEDETPVDPYEAFRQELRAKPGKWYVIHSYAGFEKRVKQNIEQRKGSLGQEDSVFEVQVPMEDVVEIKNGQRKLVNRVRIPGYVLVRMELNEDS
ncbi:MAG TPA: transcription termination/antitermination NusG family protein, partial [Amnibacterium sp.]|nr:transcription termination/antitermination NusG family protein [Amnibacterium sp.]